MTATEPPGATLRTRKQDFVREAIWTTAIDLFAAQCFEETTVDEIGAAAGTSRRTFFRYFESKRDLLAQPVGKDAATITAVIETCPRKLPPAALLRAVVLEVANQTLTDPRMLKVMTIAAKHAAALRHGDPDRRSRRCRANSPRHSLTAALPHPGFHGS